MHSDAVVASVFEALADGTRRSICEVLSHREQTVGELVVRFPISQPAVSRHLRVLREAGLVSAEVRGRTRRYRLDPGGFVPVQRWLVLHGFWSGRLDALTALLDEQPADPEENQA